MALHSPHSATTNLYVYAEKNNNGTDSSFSDPIYHCRPSILRRRDSVHRHLVCVAAAEKGELVRCTGWDVVSSLDDSILNPRLVLCLHLGAIVALVASILDLAQILVRGEQNVNQGTDFGAVTGLTNTREVLFGLSFGFQFVFYWAFVSQPPVGERLSRNVRHSGSWRRWGTTGLVIQCLSLAGCLAIPPLQILYRVVNSLDKKGTIYNLLGGLQIGLSMLFFLKSLYSIIFWAPGTSNILSKQKAIVVSIPVLASMLTSMWLGVGNVAECTSLRCQHNRYIDIATFSRFH